MRPFLSEERQRRKDKYIFAQELEGLHCSKCGCDMVDSVEGCDCRCHDSHRMIHLYEHVVRDVDGQIVEVH